VRWGIVAVWRIRGGSGGAHVDCVMAVFFGEVVWVMYRIPEDEVGKER
jgi:hypothetical protein